MDWTILAGVSIYMAAMLLLGVYLRGRISTSLDFINAGRNLGLPIATATLFATWFCGGTILGAAGAAYEEGLKATAADPFGAGAVLIIAGLLVMRPLRRMGMSTIVTFYEVRYNKTVGLLASVAQMICYLGWLGAILVAFGLTMQMITGLSSTVSIILAAVVVMIYTVLGGMWAVAVTDFVQMIILVVGLLVIFPVTMSRLGGWAAYKAALPEGFLEVWPRGGDFRVWMSYVALFLSLGLGCLPEEALIQRGTSARTERVAVWASYLGGLLYLTIGLIPPFLGMAASLIVPGLEDPEISVLLLAKELLHSVPLTIFLSGLLAAFMSSADSASLAPASILGDNVYRYFRPQATDENVLKVCRIMVPIFIAVSGVVAVKVQAVYSLMVDAYTVLLVSLVVPLLGGLYWKRANVPGAAAAMVCGFGVWAYFYTFPTWWSEIVTADLIGLFTSLAAFIVFSVATQRTHKPKPVLDMEGRVIPVREMLGIISPIEKSA